MNTHLIIGLMFAISACGILPARSAVLSYTDPALGIVFEYPSGWTLQTRPQEPVDLVLTSFDPANPPHKLDGDGTTIKMTIRHLSTARAPGTLEEWKYYLLDEQHIDGTSLYISGEELLTLSNGSSLEHVIVASGSGGIYHFAYLILGDRHLEFSVEGVDFSPALEVIDTIRLQPGSVGPSPEPEENVPLSLWKLKNARYHSPDWGDYELENGIYFRKPDHPDASPQLFSSQIFEPVAFGDLNGDGSQDAAVILQTYNGGNGDTKELAAVLNEKGEALNVSTVYLGSRIAVDSILIESGIIILSLRVHGPNDGLCCPSQFETWMFRLDGQLIRLP